MLRPGARIGVVAPAGVFSPDRLACSQALVEGWGFACVHAPRLFARHRFTAGTAEQRTADLRWALTAADLDAVWFARGGYGTVETLAGLPWARLPTSQRPVIGFSDASALFAGLLCRPGLGIGVHGPVLQSLADLADGESQAHLRRLLSGGSGVLPARHLAGPRAPVRAPVVGGNLCVLASVLGTPWAMPMSGRILVIEDVGEAPYRLDRTLMQLLASGSLDQVAAICLGEFRGTRVPEGAGWALEDMFLDRLAPLGVPIYCDLPVGHGPRNFAFIQGGLGHLGPEGLRVGSA